LGIRVHTDARASWIDASAARRRYRRAHWISLLALALLGGCRDSGGAGARHQVTARCDASDEPAPSAAQAVEPPPRPRGWLRPKSGPVSFFAQDAKSRSRRAGKITYLDGDGNPVKVGSIKQVPPQYRGAIVGQAGSLGRGGGYSVLSFPELPPPPKSSDDPPAHASNKPAPEKGQAARVLVYGTPWCPACKEARAYLTRKGIPFRARDIEDDSTALAEYTSYGDNKVPLIVIGETAVHGFQPRAVDRALRDSGLLR